MNIENEFGLGSVTVEVAGVTLAVGDSTVSPHARVDFDFGTIDDGTYPIGQQGSCTVTRESTTTYQFSCTGLLGIGSGEPLSASGYVQCG